MPIDKNATKDLFKQREDLVKSDPRIDVMTAVVRRLRPQWKEVEPRDVFYLSASAMYIYKGHGNGAYYCCNKGGYHNSSGVYWCFESVGQGKVHQRCFCPKPDVSDTRQCACSAYRSGRRSLEKKETETLWPNPHKLAANPTTGTKRKGSNSFFP